ncbi:hypothetical protein [Ruminococcus albus]|uniref:Conserved domain protein n=1 Tax=Ruminococcus albus 8 TaxID=246199 RepID=E9SAY3_RUMAL|nr:hypothetical protein [Ruminococcus albus]EGC03521.1 conserved domain protein [Ruminococcus albus 8]MCC3349949.1 hypothetical protein [Ruminococcus albus 8]
MNYRKYEELLRRTYRTAPAPLESGVQALVFMYLDELFENCIGYEPVIIDRMKKDSVYGTCGGVSDIAIVRNDLDYDNSKKDKDTEKSKIRFCVEVKEIKKSIDKDKFRIQFLGHLLTFGEGIITNGKKWEHYRFMPSENDKNILKPMIEKYITLKEKKKEENEQLNSLIEKIMDHHSVKELFENPSASFELVKHEDKKLKVDPNIYLELTKYVCVLIQELNKIEVVK